MKTVNGMTVYEGADKCSLDEYSAKIATEVPELIKENKYNDEAIKKEITEIKNKNEFQDKDIENLQQKNIQLQEELEQTKTNLENYAIHGKSTGEYMHLTDSSETDCRVDVKGNVKQVVTEISPSLEHPSKIETVKGSVKVTSSSANTLDLTKLSITEKPNIEIDDISANEVTFHTTNNNASSYYLRFKTILKKGTYYVRKLYNLINGTAVTGNNGSGVIFISKSDWSKEFIRLYNNVEKGSFSLQEDTEVYITLMLGTVENGKIRFYNLMLANSDVNYAEHKEDSVVLPIQEEMLEGDYLDKVNKKEVHTWEKRIWNGTENWTLDAQNTNDEYISFRTQIEDMVSLNSQNTQLITDKIINEYGGITLNKEHLWVYGINVVVCIKKERLESLDVLGFKKYLTQNNVIVYYKLAEPKKLDLTQEQIQVLEKLDKLKTYKNITNITTDSIAILDVDYKKDLETVLSQVTKEREA